MVVRSFSTALLSRICRSNAARVAAHKCAARVDTIWHTVRVAMQSSTDGSSPRPQSTFSALAKPSSSLQINQKTHSQSQHQKWFSDMLKTLCSYVRAIRTQKGFGYLFLIDTFYIIWIPDNIPESHWVLMELMGEKKHITQCHYLLQQKKKWKYCVKH